MDIFKAANWVNHIIFKLDSYHIIFKLDSNHIIFKVDSNPVVIS